MSAGKRIRPRASGTQSHTELLASCSPWIPARAGMNGVRDLPVKTTNVTRFGPCSPSAASRSAREVDLVLERRIPMRQDDEWFVLEVPQAGAGTRYRFRIVD